ncbi:MAG TPA: sugar phosphate isomerase/epimerase family protein [Longimicrobiales bacterium]|nr:sugar phosphate isomerase/epimerase family protein [Longimicrobiales bacterium]
MATTAINILSDELQDAADFCRAEEIGGEVTALAYPDTLDSDDLPRVVSRHRDALNGVELASHGPFLDLYVTSRDPRIVEVCRRRHESALRASIELGARIYVAHLNSVPLIRNKSYVEDFAARAAAFWEPLAEMAWEGGATIALENMWEEGPDLQRQVVERVGHPGLRTSFDNGHALVFSNVPAAEWMATLGSTLKHCHLHDNDGHYDSHLPIGNGVEDWPRLLDALSALESAPLVVLECDTLARNRESLAAWRRLEVRSTGDT